MTIFPVRGPAGSNLSFRYPVVGDQVIHLNPLLEYAPQIDTEDARGADRPEPEALRYREHVVGRKAILGNPGFENGG